MLVYVILSSIGMLHQRHSSFVVVAAVAAEDEEEAGAPLMCYLDDSDKCPDSYSEQSTNEEQGITYCYNGTVEPNSWVEGNTPTITVGGTPTSFNTLGNCAAVVTEDGGTTTSAAASGGGGGGGPTSASSKVVYFVTQFLFLLVLRV